MKFKQFDKIIKPVLMLVALLAVVGAASIMLNMLTAVYQDTAVYGTVQSVNGSSITLTDGRMFNSAVQDINRYCEPGQDIRIEIEYDTAIWCNNNKFSVNVLEDFT